MPVRVVMVMPPMAVMGVMAVAVVVMVTVMVMPTMMAATAPGRGVADAAERNGGNGDSRQRGQCEFTEHGSSLL